ncbi:MAG: DUF7487 domain-containing protein [Nitrosopumilaceae archaeon]
MYSSEIKEIAQNSPNHKDIKKLRELTGLNLNRKDLLSCILNDITPPKCKVCDRIVHSWDPKKMLFRVYCSLDCVNKSSDRITKIKQTNLERYGAENPFQLKEIQDKIKQTNLKKYGVDNPLKSEKVKEKIKQTNLERYGAENPQQNKAVQDKIKQTNLKKYGVEWNIISTQSREKQKQTNLKKYGTEWNIASEKSREKRKKTCLEKYGVKNTSQKHLTQFCLEKLNNPVWLKEQHVKKSLTQIAHELGMTPAPLGEYFRKYKIKVSPVKFSHKAVLWLESIIKKENIFIQHAQNIGEYKVPGTRIKVDGYCQKTNTIYEFYGDYYHGNPKIFESNYITFMYKTAGELYQQTLQRQNKIKELGYNLVVIWENEFRDLIQQQNHTKLFRL